MLCKDGLWAGSGRTGCARQNWIAALPRWTTPQAVRDPDLAVERRRGKRPLSPKPAEALTWTCVAATRPRLSCSAAENVVQEAVSLPVLLYEFHDHLSRRKLPKLSGPHAEGALNLGACRLLVTDEGRWIASRKEMSRR